MLKRPDGFHEIETLIVAVSAFDRLIFVPEMHEELALHCRWADGFTAWQRSHESEGAARELLDGQIPRGPENLVWRAAELVRERAEIGQGATICLVKQIPAAAGLGGASSDAAATLVAANIAWRLGWSMQRLMDWRRTGQRYSVFPLLRCGGVPRARPADRIHAAAADSRCGSPSASRPEHAAGV